MAIIYVNDDGDNTDGSTWAHAYTSLTNAAVLAAAAGTDIYVGHDHKETGTAAVALAFTTADNYGNPIRILCVNTGTGALATGAEVETTGGTADITLTGNCLYVRGIRFDTTDDLTIGGASDNITLDTCVLEVTDSLLIAGGVSSRCRITCIGTTLDNKDTGLLNINCNNNEHFLEFKNCVFAASGGTPTAEVFGAIGAGMVVVVQDSDLSARSGASLIDSAVTGSSGKCGLFTFRRCKLPTSYDVLTTEIAEPSAEVLLEACDDGTITDPPLMEYYTYYGTVKSDLTHYRTGGADDGENANAYSWAIVATASRTVEIFSPLRSPPITRWVEPKSSISGATARGLFSNSTRCAILGTPADQAADAVSTWNGAGVGTKQKLTHTLSNGSTLTLYFAHDAQGDGTAGALQNDEFWMEVSEPDQVGGPVSVTVCLAVAAGATVYVDPKLEIT